MTRAEFRALLKRHGYTPTSFAREVGVSYWSVIEWGGSRVGVPRWVRAYLARIEEIRVLRAA